MEILERAKSDKRFAVGCFAVIVAAVGIPGYLIWDESRTPAGETGQTVANLREASGDCFIPKEGDAECVVDVVEARVDRVTDEECQGVRATLTFDTEITALDLQRQGEAVMQIHPPGQTNDGSADTGVGRGLYGGSWQDFSFGPGGVNPAPGVVSAEWEGRTATLRVNRFADGSCLTDDSEMRIKTEMTNPAGERIYDLVGLEELMEYHTIEEYLESFPSK